MITNVSMGSFNTSHAGMLEQIGSGKAKFYGQLLASFQQKWRFLQLLKATQQLMLGAQENFEFWLI